MQPSSALLKGKKLKVTPQRLAVYNYLLSVDTHPSAKDIYAALEEDHPTMSLATVYKTLGTLEASGLISGLTVSEDRLHYDANTSEHPHLVCVRCQKIYDYHKTGFLDELKREIMCNTGFLIKREQVYFFGECSDCRSSGEHER